MGVYIKGMEMPKNCASCDIACRHYLDFGADGLLSKICRTESRIPDCPLVPIPPHGRLIDADALEKDIDKYIGGEESRSRFHHWVQVQRTVIPESEEART